MDEIDYAKLLFYSWGIGSLIVIVGAALYGITLFID